jgi:hypothetical protein
MNVRFSTESKISWLASILLHLCISFLQAGQSGIYTYSVTPENTIAITRAATGATGEITIPATLEEKPVTAIWSYAFHSCEGITGIILPSSLTSISDWAFLYCRNLTSITFPPSLGSIGNWAFYDCIRLQSLNLPPLLSSIGKGAFQGCVGLGNFVLPSGLLSIGDSAFGRCTGLTSISIPASVTTIGTGVFSSCSSLFSVQVHPDNQTYSSLDGVLFDKARTTLISFPAGSRFNYIMPAPVTSIRPSAFEGCRSLPLIRFPSTLTSIPENTFSTCSALTSFSVHSQNPNYSTLNGVLFNKSRTTLIAYPVGNGGAYTIPQGVTTIGGSAFNLAFNLTSVTCPDSLVTIGNDAFYACVKLNSFTFSQTITSIGIRAFAHCSGLTKIALPASVLSIGSGAFSSCRNLARFAFLGNAPVNVSLSDIASAPSAAFTTYWLKGKSGFTAPEWQGYPAVMIDETSNPAAAWFLQYDLSYDTDLHQDPNGDGVSYLMAYALNLDPRLNLRSSLPAPELYPDRLSLRFHAGASGITYTVETSEGLDQWTTEGVILSEPGADQFRIASVPRNGPLRYLRLKVAD